MQQKTFMISIHNSIIMLLLLLSCSTTDESGLAVEQSEQTPNLKSDFSYLALGDSYTVGESVAHEDSFPIQLTNRLEEQLNKTLDPTIIATTGWRTDDLLNAIDASDTNEPYDIVNLLIGVNNQYQKRSFSQYENEFPKLLEQAIDLAGNDTNRVFVISIPDYAYTPFAINSDRDKISREIDRYNSFAKMKTEEQNVVFIGITDITRQGLDEPELVATDGLHPSGLAYEKFVDRILPFALAKLKD